MKSFKKQLVFFDAIGYKEAEEKANRKVNIYKQALVFAEKYIVVFDKEAFAQDFVGFFKAEFYKLHKENNHLQLPIDKLLFVKDVDLTRLINLQQSYKDDQSKLSFDTADGIPVADIDRTPYERWTKSEEENKRFQAGRSVIEAVKKAEGFTKVYPLTIQQATSGLVRFNQITNEYYVNVGIA